MHGTQQSLAKMACPCGSMVCFFRFIPDLLLFRTYVQDLETLKKQKR